MKIGVSSCLIGNKVRYDGKHQLQDSIVELMQEFELIPFCPEMAIGLGAPREKIQLIEINSQIHCVDQATQQKDYTQALRDCCEQEQHWLNQISGYIFKTKSPSCGLTKVKTDYHGEIVANGQGIFAQQLIKKYPNLPIIEDDEFQDPLLAKQFLTKVKAYRMNV